MKSNSSTEANAIKEKLKVAELMMEASFFKKRKDAEHQTWSLMLRKN